MSTVTSSAVDLEPVFTISLNTAVDQCRSAPLCLGKDGPRAFISAYCADFDVDPFTEMFFFPTDTLKLAVYTETGEILWKRDLGPGVVPGMWFVPVFPFDLDGDGIDEIWFVNNSDPKHPLGAKSYKLERLDPLTGKMTGQWTWPSYHIHQALSRMFRNFIVGGTVRGEPVLVTAQGTYGVMLLQAWNADMSKRWEIKISENDPGARGSHMCPVVDINHDGVDELMWGERCIELDKGTELFCADRDVYNGHSDVIQPMLDRDSNRWYIYTCRESHREVGNRVGLFDDHGNRVWGAVDQGHMDMGWVARLGDDGRHIAMAIRIGKKTCGPDGRFHHGCEEFTFDALTGKPFPLPFSTYRTRPIDINGDGLHEILRAGENGEQQIIDRHGNRLATFQGDTVLVGKVVNLPGEQMLVARPGGTIQLLTDRNAEDSPAATARFKNPFYLRNLYFSSTGSNSAVLGGV